MLKVSSSRLKAKLGEYLRAVRDGREVIITDRDRPVARLTQIDDDTPDPTLVLARPRRADAPALGELVVEAIDARDTDSTEAVRSDRDRR